MLTNILRRVILGKKEKFKFVSYMDGMIDFNSINDHIGFYIHIPFCKKICPYCPYNKTLYNKKIAENYRRALLKEITYYRDEFNNQQITSVYFGGGTPTLMLPTLKEVINLLKELYGFSGNIGVEVYPTEVNNQLLDELLEMGVNLISIGVQTFNDRALEFLGRDYREREIEQVLTLVKQYNFKCIDVDIMTNIPGQTLKDIEYDLKKVYSYDIDQLSIYPLIVFPLTPMSQIIKKNKLSRFSELQEGKILKIIDIISKEYDYDRSSVWTYGKSKSNRYTSVTRETFIGFGAGASSHFDTYFYLNTFNVNAYIEAIEARRKPINLVNRMSEREKMIFWFFWRCYEGVINQKRFKNLFHKDMLKEFKLAFRIAKLFGMTKNKGDNIVLTNLGRFIYHYIEKQYSIHYLNRLWEISMRKPWIEEVKL
ncbi:coproporphyrinogen-III oxidase family protein [Vallitalea okinawensis]|uniref:coproporphyrinogen-III oxidase family protein n=1 Tax=Vallitalea okinawensis TaxID=2078660 RepID=UPI000CFBCE09|nr:coproporphyrinogen-III oxidase family protein [Vallitalea okinawensis]